MKFTLGATMQISRVSVKEFGHEGSEDVLHKMR